MYMIVYMYRGELIRARGRRMVFRVLFIVEMGENIVEGAISNMYIYMAV
jgi:hypothetical protein